VDAENQMAALEDRFAAELSQIRSDIKTMHKELDAALTKADKAQEKRADQLDEDKVARKDLSVLLTGLAKSLQPGKASRSK
jgi:hypothetical protein